MRRSKLISNLDSAAQNHIKLIFIFFYNGVILILHPFVVTFEASRRVEAQDSYQIQLCEPLPKPKPLKTAKKMKNQNQYKNQNQNT